MFERKVYKDIAKKQLKGRWLTPILSTLFIFAIYLLLSAPEYFIGFKSLLFNITHLKDFITYNKMRDNNSYSNFFGFNYMRTCPVNRPGSSSFSLIYLLIMGILAIAQIYLYICLSHTTEKQPFSTFIKGFSLWLQGLLGGLWFILWVTLWTLLFLIPGIVKAFSYSQMFFILAEYPDIGVRRAMQISKEMTKGYKSDLFVMMLSFIGWYILSLCTFGIGFLWLIPYQNMSYTNSYHALKAQALQTGNLNENDFIKK